MEKNNYDFAADSRFLEENYGLLCRLYLGKTLVVHNQEVLFVSDSTPEADSRVRALCLSGKCTVKELTGNMDKDFPTVKLYNYGLFQ